MPRLPTAEDLGERPTPRTSTAVTTMRTGAVESAVANIGQTIDRIGAELTKARRSSDLTDALGQATEALGVKAIEYQRDTEFTTAPVRFKADAAGIGKGIAEKLTDPEVRQIFNQEYGKLAVAKQLGVVQHAARQEGEHNVARLDQSLDTFANAAANATSPMERQVVTDQARIAIGEMRSGGWITEGQSRQMTDKFATSMLESMRLTNPVAAMAEFQRIKDKMDPLTAGRFEQHLFQHAAPVLAAEVVAKGLPSGPSVGVVAPDKNGYSPRGLRNNNPGNIQKSDTPWQGKIEGSDTRYESFATPEAGIRAMGKNLLSYQQEHGLDTVAGVIARWAPATENDTASYIAAVANAAGVAPDAKIDLTNEATLRKVVGAMIVQENGSNPYTDAQIRAGLVAATGKGELPKAAPGKMVDFALITPDQAASVKTGNPVIDALPPDQKMRVFDMARTMAKQDNSQARAALQQRVADATAMYVQGVSPPNPPSGAELMSTFGQVEGAKLARNLEHAQQFGQDVKSLAPLPPDEQVALIKSRTPLPGEGFADAQSRQQALIAAQQEVLRQREKAPAVFTIQNSPPVATAFEAFQKAQGTPKEQNAAAQAYAQATLAEQQRLGILDQRVLPDQMVDQIARQFSAPPKEGQNTANVMQGMMDTWGNYWPVVGKQLAKVLPPFALTIGFGVKPEAADLLSEVAKLKPSELKQGIPEPDLRTLDENVRTQLEALHQTTKNQTNGQWTYNNYADSTTAVATLLMQKGASPKDAAAKAAESIVNFKYEYNDMWRVPKEVLGPHVDVGMLQRGADGALHDIARDLPPSSPDYVALPPPLVPEGVRSTDAEKQWRMTVKNSGFWVTSPGDGGLTLQVKTRLTSQPVLGADGKPITRAWDELGAIGAGHPSFNASVYRERGLR